MRQVSIRGTHGSGKSTIVTTIMSLYPTQPLPGPKRRPVGYVVDLPTGQHLYVPGPYDTACGGCDAIQPYSLIIPQLEDAVNRGYHVLFEGALVSSSYGTVGEWMNAQEDPIFAFLDTPLDKCLERIASRRWARWQAQGKTGFPPPVNPANTATKHDNVARTKHQMDKLGSRVAIVDIDHTRAVKQVLALFGVKLPREPKVGQGIRLAQSEFGGGL